VHYIEMNYGVESSPSEDRFTALSTNIDLVHLDIFGTPSKGSSINADHLMGSV